MDVRINPGHFKRNHTLATARRLQKQFEQMENVTISHRLLAALIFFAERDGADAQKPEQN